MLIHTRPLALAALLLSSSALAQEARPADPPAGEAQTADDVVVIGQQAQKQVVSDGVVGVLGAKSALETPFNLTTYTAKLVLDQQSETIGDVLKNEPSVRTTYGFGNQSEQFVIRGFPLYGDDVAIDGLFGVTPRQLVSPELYEGIQVLNGANAFLYGAAPGGSGIGGSINLIPKRAEKTLLRATASYSEQSIFGGNVDVGTRFGADEVFGIRVNGVYRKGEAAIDGERREVKVAGASFDFRKGPGRFFLDVGYEGQRSDVGRPIVQVNATAVPRAPRADANYAQNWSYTALRDIYALARAELDIAPNVTAYMAAGIRDGSEKGEYSTLTVTNGATGAAQGGRLYVPRADNNESGQAGIRGKITTGSITNEFNAGASINLTENRNSYAFGEFPAAQRQACGAFAIYFCTNLYAPVQVAKPGNSTIAGFVAGSFTNLPRVSTGDFSSFFGSDTLGAFNDHVLVTVGFRRQRIQTSNYNRTTFARTSHYDRSTTTPVIGLVVRPTDRLSFYANRIEGLVQGQAAPINVNTLNQGEVFAPFKSKQYEVGGKLAIRGLTATAAVYQIKQPSAYNVATPTATNPNAVTFSVDGRQRNRGIELSLNGEPSRFVRLIGGLTVNDAKLTRTAGGASDGKTAIGVPDFQANVGAEIVLPFLPAATLTGRVVHTSEQQVNIANTLQIPGWTRFDIGARYILVTDEHPITLRVSADNVGNKGYWASSFGGYLLQGAPRTIKASATVEF